ncbi:hypothetical protein [Lysinibacillus sphaericus]|uniref:hypothetical protein n=1 Tax=Lysinibacillus sphaericus TaxID=1421 RepID=UPI001E4BB29A|nr:hypothetical protein [Lysinibacillus sphaericus]
MEGAIVNCENKNIKLYMNDGKIFDGILTLYEESPDDEEMVLIVLSILGHTISYQHENFFQALQSLRQNLEEKKIQIMCNGAALNIYPSQMQLSMGSGRLAYKLKFGKPAISKDIVDIFECEDDLMFVKIEDQLKYYYRWLKSLG